MIQVLVKSEALIRDSHVNHTELRLSGGDVKIHVCVCLCVCTRVPAWRVEREALSSAWPRCVHCMERAGAALIEMPRAEDVSRPWSCTTHPSSYSVQSASWHGSWRAVRYHISTLNMYAF